MQTRHMRPDGFKTFVVHNLSELEVLLMHNRSYCAEIGHSVSSKNRREIVQRAQVFDGITWGAIRLVLLFVSLVLESCANGLKIIVIHVSPQQLLPCHI